MAAALGREAPAEDVWRENWPIVEAFLAAATQWRVAALAGEEAGRLFFIGLDYAGALPGIAAAGIAMTPEIFEGLRIMEAAARDAINEAAGSGQ